MWTFTVVFPDGTKRSVDVQSQDAIDACNTLATSLSAYGGIKTEWSDA
jgi:hypothetical protein